MRKRDDVPTIVWYKDPEQGYWFASVYIGGPINRSYMRGDIAPHYPLPVCQPGS